MDFKNKGFVKIVFLAIIIIATLAYFNIDLRAIFESPIVAKIGNIFVTAWVTYIKPLLMYLYKSIYGLFN